MPKKNAYPIYVSEKHFLAVQQTAADNDQFLYTVIERALEAYPPFKKNFEKRKAK